MCHHANLMVNAAHIQDIETKLGVACSRLSGMHARVQKVRGLLLGPHARMAQACVRLERLTTTLTTLRACLRVARLTQKLRSLIADAAPDPQHPRLLAVPHELAVAAGVLAEASDWAQSETLQVARENQFFFFFSFLFFDDFI